MGVYGQDDPLLYVDIAIFSSLSSITSAQVFET